MQMATRWMLCVAAWLLIGAAASPAVAQSCCRCDYSPGSPASCNTGSIADQATCEEICGSLGVTFGQFQTCPAGMVIQSCSQDLSTYCDIACVAAPTGSVAAPAMSTSGIVVAIGILVGFGGRILRRRQPTASD
jgi:hypothetical protein